MELVDEHIKNILVSRMTNLEKKMCWIASPTIQFHNNDSSIYCFFIDIYSILSHFGHALERTIQGITTTKICINRSNNKQKLNFLEDAFYSFIKNSN